MGNMTACIWRKQAGREMFMDTRIAVIAIIVEDRSKSGELNRLLHEYGEYIVGRMGVPYRPKGVSVISVILDAPQERSALCPESLECWKALPVNRVLKNAGERAMKELIDKLHHTQELTREEFLTLLSNRNTETDLYARRLARGVRQKIYGDQVYIRGLIEFTSYCRNDCYYCGLRRSNHAAQRYRLTEEDILSCCQQGYELGFRTFVLQGGEDGYFTGERLAGLVRHIKKQYPDCALTLSVGGTNGGRVQSILEGRSRPLSSSP